MKRKPTYHVLLMRQQTAHNWRIDGRCECGHWKADNCRDMPELRLAFDRHMQSGTCTICGPQEPPTVHVYCHDDRCGHPIAEHSPSLRCRRCHTECGIDASRMILDGIRNRKGV